MPFAQPLGDYTPLVRRVNVPGTSLRVATVGSGPPILLINGIGASLEMWRPFAAPMSRTRSVIMFDAPGTGKSPGMRRPLRMKGLASLVVDLMDGLELDRVDVLGFSWGGALAQQLAFDAPGRVGKLVLAATMPGAGSQPPSPMVVGMMMSPMRYASPRYLSFVAPFIYGGDARRPDEHQRELLKAWQVKPPKQRGYSHQLYALSTWSSLRWLPRVTAQTLIIQGEDDPLVAMRNGRIMARRMPNAKLHVVAGGGHLWLLEHADEAATLIERFLAG